MKPEYTLKTLIKVNGQDVTAIVDVYCEQDDIPLDMVIGDLEDRAELERQIGRGDLMIAVVSVKAKAFGLSGRDSLGGVYIKSRQDLDQTVAEHSMIANACQDLSERIIETANRLKPFAS